MAKAPTFQWLRLGEAMRRQGEGLFARQPRTDAPLDGARDRGLRSRHRDCAIHGGSPAVILRGGSPAVIHCITAQWRSFPYSHG